MNKYEQDIKIIFMLSLCPYTNSSKLYLISKSQGSLRKVELHIFRLNWRNEQAIHTNTESSTEEGSELSKLSHSNLMGNRNEMTNSIILIDLKQV